MAYNSAQIEKDKRGFVTPITETRPEVIGKLRTDILDARDKLQTASAELMILLDIEYEVARSLWSELRQERGL